MKKFSLIILAFALSLGLTQCKPEPEQGTKKIPVRFEMQIDNDAKTDFTDFFVFNGDSTSVEIGSIKWTGDEVLYLAVPDYKPKYTWEDCDDMIRMTPEFSNGKVSFTCEMDPDGWGVAAISEEDTYVYYFGSGKNVTQTKKDDGRVSETIIDFSNQDGEKLNLKDLHFAKLKVYPIVNLNENEVPESITLKKDETDDNFTNEIAICYLDLQNESKITGEVVVNNMIRIYCTGKSSFTTEYTTSPSGEGININPTPENKGSFVAILPTNFIGDLKCNKGTYNFDDHVTAGKIYYGKGVGNNKIEPLPWTPNP